MFYVLAGIDGKEVYYLKDNCVETTSDLLKAKMFRSLNEIKKFRKDNLEWLDFLSIIKIETNLEVKEA